MRVLATLITACTLLLLPATSRAQEQPNRPFGLGLVIGAPTGLTAKYYLARPMALQFGLGAVDHYGHHEGLHIHADVLWHPAILARTNGFTLPFYLGVGARMLYTDHDHFDRDGDFRYHHDGTHLGARAPFGLLMDFHRVPLDVFLELAMVVDIVHFDDDPHEHDHDHFSVYGGLGIRYYF